jgi:hypothetical protein
VQLNGKWGYVDPTGGLVIPAQFTEAYDFVDGLARVATGPKHDSTQDFRFFLTATGYGFIDKAGKMVIPATWKDASDFSEGLAPVMQEGSQGSPATYGRDVCGYINTKGQVVIPLKFEAVTGFSEGLAAVWTSEGWGYIDKSGAWAVSPKPDLGPVGGDLGVPDDDYLATMNLPVRSFRDGYAAVGVCETESDPDTQTWHFIDETGRQAEWSGTYGQAGPFNEGLAPIKDLQTEKWGFINANGKVVIAPQFDDYFADLGDYILTWQGFHQGLAAVVSDGKVGYIDQSGKWVIQPQFANANGFADGYAYVRALSSDPTATYPPGITVPVPGPLEIIDLTGRVIYRAPEALGGTSTSSS